MVQVALQTMSWSRDATLLPEHHRCIFRQGTNPTAPSSEVQHCLCIPYFHDAIIIIAGSLGIHGKKTISICQSDYFNKQADTDLPHSRSLPKYRGKSTSFMFSVMLNYCVWECMVGIFIYMKQPKRCWNHSFLMFPISQPLVMVSLCTTPYYSFLQYTKGRHAKMMRAGMLLLWVQRIYTKTWSRTISVQNHARWCSPSNFELCRKINEKGMYHVHLFEEFQFQFRPAGSIVPTCIHPFVWISCLWPHHVV